MDDECDINVSLTMGEFLIISTKLAEVRDDHPRHSEARSAFVKLNAAAKMAREPVQPVDLLVERLEARARERLEYEDPMGRDRHRRW